MKNARILAVSILAGLAATAQADMSFTAVRPAPGSELGHQAILTQLYGGTWSTMGLSTRDYTNGTVSVVRYADEGATGVQSIAIGAAPNVDQLWSGSNVRVQARAKYAGDRHTFGWFDDTVESPTFKPIVSTSNFSETTDIMVSDSFRWALNDITTGTTWTSRASDNIGPDGKAYDQLVTYRVYGVDPSQAIWLLCWEDRIGASRADYDYNDSVIELRTSTAVPAPGAMAALGLAGLVGSRRRSR
jgi:hypothetical protein